MIRRYMPWALLLVALPVLSAVNPDVSRLDQRLMALQANPQSSGVAAYERLQAQTGGGGVGQGAQPRTRTGPVRGRA